MGLDGATPELIDRWVEEDKLPYLKQIMQRGVYGKLRSVYPPISPAAWTTFATGYNPGKHGVYDFRDYDNTRYSCFADTIVDSNSFAGKTIWDLAGAAGEKVGVVTVPVTYPAWKVNGFMISGYPTPDTGKSFTYPPELGKTIPLIVGDAAFFKSATGHVLLKEMNRLMHVCTDVSIDLMKKDDYGLFIMVVGATDRAHHDWWKYIDPDHPAYNHEDAKLYGDLILEVYKEADACVGKFLAAIDDETTVIVMSDHGGGAHPRYYLNTNALLRTMGLLQPSGAASKMSGPRAAFKQFYRTKIRRFPYLEKVYRSLPQGLRKMATNLDSQTMMNLDAVDWKHTRAYRFPMYPPVEGIMINVVGRQPEGCVQPGEEYEAIRTRILEEVRNLRDPKTGELIVLEAYRREELYHGERLETAPDLILVTKDEYKGGTSVDDLVSDVPLDVLSKLSGVHRMDGILLAQGPHIRRNASLGEDAGIIDVAPTVMFTLGLPIPTDMDGKPLAGLFETGYMQQSTASYTDERQHVDVASDEYGYSAEEEENVRLKLEALGYL